MDSAQSLNHFDGRHPHTMGTPHGSTNAKARTRTASDSIERRAEIAFIGDEVRSGNIEIAERLQARDPLILDELMARYEQRLLRYLIHLTSDAELSEDIVQETWVRVLTRGSQFKGNSQFVTWLYAIARNLVFDLRRRRSWTRSLEEFTEQGDERRIEFPSKEKTPFDRCADGEHAGVLAEALLNLRSDQRELVDLRFHRDMSLNEIAQITGTSLSTVKSRLYRTLAVLRPQVKEALAMSSAIA